MMRKTTLLIALLMSLLVMAQQQAPVLIINGTPLHAADSYVARLQDGMRSFVARHKTWGPKAVVRVKAVTSLTGRQSVWRLRTEGFQGPVKLEVVTAGKASQRLSQVVDDECFVCCDSVATTIDPRAGERFDEAEQTLRQVATRLVFNTPDAAINTLGGSLAVAAQVLGVDLFSADVKSQVKKVSADMYSPIPSDSVAIYAQRVIRNLLGICPPDQQGWCIIQPDIPDDWQTYSVHTPIVSYSYQRYGQEAVYEVTQHGSQPQQVIIRQNLGMGRCRDVKGTAQQHQYIRVQVPVPLPEVRVADSHGTE